jgi:hypothetical protein
MKTKLTFLSLAITLLSSCYHTTIKDIGNCGNNGYRREMEYTNTSGSKYIEVTIKYEEQDRQALTRTKRLKPGEITTDCEEHNTKISVVGEREITENK